VFSWFATKATIFGFLVFFNFRDTFWSCFGGGDNGNVGVGIVFSWFSTNATIFSFLVFCNFHGTFCSHFDGGDNGNVGVVRLNHNGSGNGNAGDDDGDSDTDNDDSNAGNGDTDNDNDNDNDDNNDSVDSEVIKQFLNMGFTREQAIGALEKHDYDAHMATNYLLDLQWWKYLLII